MEKGTGDGGPVKEMPRYRYQSHKLIFALKIKEIIFNLPAVEGIQKGEAIFTPEEEGFAEITLDADYVKEHQPKVGGYYIVFEDGYKSFSLPGLFESGYRRLEDIPSLDVPDGLQREKNWKDLSIEEKVERLRAFTKGRLDSLGLMLESVQVDIRNVSMELVFHKHLQQDGEATIALQNDRMKMGVFGLGETDRRLKGEGRRSPDPDDVFI